MGGRRLEVREKENGERGRGKGEGEAYFFAISTTRLSIAASTVLVGWVWWFTWIEKVSHLPSGRSMYPESELTRPMLPVLARTWPSRGVPTKRVRSEPTPPATGSPSAKAG